MRRTAPETSGEASGGPAPIALAALLGGVGLGILSLAGDRAPAELRAVTNAGGPWLLLPFAFGATQRRIPRGIALAVGASVAAVLTYYWVPRLLFGGRGLLAWPVPTWCFVAAVCGVTMGSAGSMWRRGDRGAIAAVAVLSGSLAGEAIFLWTTRAIYASGPFVIAELAAALAAPLLLLEETRARLATLRLALLVAIAGVVGTAFLVWWVGRVYQFS